MKTKAIDNLFTLVLFVKGRDEFSQRWLKYIDEIDFKYPVIISDGANDGFVEKMIKNFSFRNNINLKFRQFDTNSGFKAYYEMKRDTLSEINTKYVMICDNDDFILENGINQILNFLETHNEYISASGNIFNFEIDNWRNTTYGNLFFLPKYKYSRENDPVEDWFKQIQSIFNSFQPNFYNIFKTSILTKIFTETADLNFSDLTINEFFIQLRSNTMGKSKILNSPHYLRQRGTSQISNNFDFSHDLLQKNLPNDVRKLKNFICTIISNENNLNKERLFDTFDKSFADYLKIIIASTMLRYRFPRLYKIKKCIKFLWYERLFFISLNIKKIKNGLFLINNSLNDNDKKGLIKVIKFLKKEKI